MRCGCPNCDAYMDHAIGSNVSCVCPFCGYRCTACLGTNTVISREDFKTLKDDPLFNARFAEDIVPLGEEPKEDDTY